MCNNNVYICNKNLKIKIIYNRKNFYNKNDLCLLILNFSVN